MSLPPCNDNINTIKQLAAQFTSLTLLEEGKTMDDVRHRLSQDFIPTLKTGACYWPFIGALNSAFIPVLSRPAFSSFTGVFWNVYISYQANHNGMEVGDVGVVYTRKRTGENGATREIVGAEALAMIAGEDDNAAQEEGSREKLALVRRTSAVSM